MNIRAVRHLKSTWFSLALNSLFVVGTAGGVLVLSSCQPQRKAPTPEERRAAEPFLVHTVQFSGETLSIIAGWYTGSARNWEFLKEANPGLNPNRIRLGDTIQIPRELITREDPLPRSALPGGSRKGGASEREARTSDSKRPTTGTSNAPVVESDMSGDDSSGPSDAVAKGAEDAQADADRLAAESLANQASSAANEAANEAAESAANNNNEMPRDAPAGSDDSTTQPSGNLAAETQPKEPGTKPEMRIKSRDELLKELLEE